MLIILGVLVAALLAAILILLWSLSRPLMALTAVQADVRGVSERMVSLEQNQGTAASNVLTATSALRTELSQTRVELSRLQSEAHVRTGIEEKVADSVRRLETIIAGTNSRGAAGENILDLVFSRLPPEWQVRDFTVGNKTVEFALRLPNDRLLPIDSKWAATDLLEQFATADDLHERQRLKLQIEAVVRGKAREVRKYLDPSLTVNFAIAAVPDAVYDLCSAVQCDCFEQNVVLVAYSMFIPYLLLVFQTVLKTSQNIDLEKLDAHLRALDESARAMQQELEGRFSQALIMLGNSREEIKAQLSRMDSSLINIRLGTHPSPLLDDDAALLLAQDEQSAALLTPDG